MSPDHTALSSVVKPLTDFRSECTYGAGLVGKNQKLQIPTPLGCMTSLGSPNRVPFFGHFFWPP